MTAQYSLSSNISPSQKKLQSTVHETSGLKRNKMSQTSIALELFIHKLSILIPECSNIITDLKALPERYISEGKEKSSPY